MFYLPHIRNQLICSPNTQNKIIDFCCEHKHQEHVKCSLIGLFQQSKLSSQNSWTPSKPVQRTRRLLLPATMAIWKYVYMCKGADVSKDTPSKRTFLARKYSDTESLIILQLNSMSYKYRCYWSQLTSHQHSSERRFPPSSNVLRSFVVPERCCCLAWRLRGNLR